MFLWRCSRLYHKKCQVFKRYKIPVIRYVTPGDVIYSLVSIVNNIILYI